MRKSFSNCHKSRVFHLICCSEITVNVNDEANTTLKVVDIIEFNVEGKIKSLRASSYFPPPKAQAEAAAAEEQ